MIAFGSAITKPETFARCAAPGIARAAEPDSVVLELRSPGSIFAAYNALLDRARALEGLEALVLLHQDTEIVGTGFCAEVRRVLADPEVALAGCVGALDVRSIAYWEGSTITASFLQRYEEDGGGELPGFTWDWTQAPPYGRLGDVDSLDGFLLVLSPWAVEHLRFDETLGQFHGYDADLCLQAREAGRRIVTANVHAIHHHALEPWSDPEDWVDAHVRMAEKWSGRMPGYGEGPGTWRERALRAEAEADLQVAMGHSNDLHTAARLAALDRAIEETRTSLSWRLAGLGRR